MCSQRRRFRFRPQNPAHAYYFRVEAVPPVSGFESSQCRAGALCPCAPLRVFVSKGRPHPEGVPVGEALQGDVPTVGEAAAVGEYQACNDRYTVTSLQTELAAAYYVSCVCVFVFVFVCVCARVCVRVCMCVLLIKDLSGNGRSRQRLGGRQHRHKHHELLPPANSIRHDRSRDDSIALHAATSPPPSDHEPCQRLRPHQRQHH